MSIVNPKTQDEYDCDGKFVSRNCKQKDRLTNCGGCGLWLCTNCYKEHREEIEDD